MGFLGLGAKPAPSNPRARRQAEIRAALAGIDQEMERLKLEYLRRFGGSGRWVAYGDTVFGRRFNTLEQRRQDLQDELDGLGG